MEPKELVIQAVSEMTIDLDLGAVDRHFAEGFVQHSPTCPPGRDGLKALMKHAKSLGVQYRWHRAIAEGEYVVLHASATGMAEVPIVIFDVYRVRNNKITEHWEAIQPEFGGAVGGRGMVDGPDEITDLDKTVRNRELVRDLIERVFIGGDDGALPEFFHGDALIQHSPSVPDGVAAVEAVVKEASAEYVMLHRILAEGDFVFTQGEGQVDGKPHAIYEVFRVENGKIAEHWEVRAGFPEEAPHGNGYF